MQTYKHLHPTIGVLAGWQLYGTLSSNNYLDSILRGIYAAAKDHQSNLLLACGLGPPRYSDAIYPAWPQVGPDMDFVPVGPWNTDGLIVINPLLSKSRSQYIQQIKTAGHPIVFIGSAEGGPAIGIGNEAGIEAAMKHLMDHGHRKIAFIAGNPNDNPGDTVERLQAYQKMVDKYTLLSEPDLIVYGHHIFDGGQRAMQHLLETGIPFTAVLASNDESAIGAMHVIKKAGLSIPKDIAIIGFDDRPLAAIQKPPLTTIHTPTFKRGYQALILLLTHINGLQYDDEIVKPHPYLVIRQSCGCQPGNGLKQVFNSIDYPSSPSDIEAIDRQIIHKMTEAVLVEARHLNRQQITIMCQTLFQGFKSTLKKDTSDEFQGCLMTVLQEGEQKGEDAYLWQLATLVLEDNLVLILPNILSENQDAIDYHLNVDIQNSPHLQSNTNQLDNLQHQAEVLLHQACISITQNMRRQHQTYRVGLSEITTRLGLLSAHLLVSMNDKDVFEILAQYLPEVGIDCGGIIFFEAEGHDEVAWSILHPIFSSTSALVRFSSYQFSPLTFSSNNQPVRLALFPLLIQNKQVGYTVLEGNNLEICGTIIRQLSAALTNAHLYKEVTQGRRVAEEATRMKNRFLSTVSHELRTPLSLIVGVTDLLLKDIQTQKLILPQFYQDQMRRVHIGAQHLDGLINDVLDLARSEIDQLNLVCERLNLNEILKTVAAIGKQLADEKNLTWQSILPDKSPTIWGDPTRLRQVILNLISNAIKFTQTGTVSLKATLDTANLNQETVTITIEDTGLGIPALEQSVIFDEFRQSDQTADKGYGGLGLGLAICKRLVILHGGEISVYSLGVSGKGSKFYVRLPIITESVSLPSYPQPKVKPEQICLLTYQPDQVELLSTDLTKSGFQVAALSIDKQQQWLSTLNISPPQAIVLDINMTADQGWEILKRLKDKPATQNIPVIFYALEQSHNHGAILPLDYLTKPVGTIDLAQAIKRQGIATKYDSSQTTILIVDDEPGILEMHAHLVASQPENYQVLRAANGREALTIMNKTQPDLVLLDLMMPEMDGFAVLEAMQQAELLRTIPVIVLTAQILTLQDMARLNKGVANILKKGVFSVEETLYHLKTVLNQTRSAHTEAQQLVRKAMAYIHEHYAEAISRQDIVNYIGVSKGHLSRCFKDELGITPITYLNRYRINQAKRLLQDDTYTIMQIAHAVGFSDSNYFSRIFRRETGQSPSTYKQKILEL